MKPLILMSVGSLAALLVLMPLTVHRLRSVSVDAAQEGVGYGRALFDMSGACSSCHATRPSSQRDPVGAVVAFLRDGRR